MAAKQVLSIGQCGADTAALRRMLTTHFDVAVSTADSAEEALAELRQGRFDLVLVNRVLDGDGASGVDLIGRIKAEASLRELPVMLVSNHEDAQQEAEAKGALKGFGKAALGQPHTLSRLRAVLG